MNVCDDENRLKYAAKSSVEREGSFPKGQYVQCFPQGII